MTPSSFAKASKPGKKARLSDSSVSSRPELVSNDRQTLLLGCLALVLAVFAAYSPVVHNGFVDYDDTGYITENAHVQAGLTWKTVKWAFLTNDAANWHPLTWLSHALDCELFGLNPAGHHLMNVLLHAANAVLLFLLLQRATGFRWRSLMVAALFALHPINVESVVWASERKNVLSMLFFLLAFYAYVRYVHKPGLGRYAAVAGLYALALMAKPQVITFPFLLLLWDYWPLGRIGAPDKHGRTTAGANLPKLPISRLVLEKVPLLLLSAISAVVTMKAQAAGGAVQDLVHYGLLSRLETAAISYVRYLGKAFWPANLVAPYPHRNGLYPLWQAGAAVALLLLVTVMVLRARQQRYLAVGWFWFLGSLVPMIGLVQVGEQALADRYAYLPFIGLFVMVVWLGGDWVAARTRNRQISSGWLAIPVVSCLLVMGTLTCRQVRYWHDSWSFWQRALTSTQDNYLAHEALASLLQKQGKTEEAVAHLRAALAIRPDNLPDHLNLGVYEHTRGNLGVAIEQYELVLDRATEAGIRAKAEGNLGFAYYQIDEPIKAKQSFEQSLHLVPTQPELRLRLGLLAQKNGDLTDAVQQYVRGLELQPTGVGYLLLANALRQEGRTEEADAMMRRAARLSSNLPQAEKQAEDLLRGKAGSIPATADR